MTTTRHQGHEVELSINYEGMPTLTACGISWTRSIVAADDSGTDVAWTTNHERTVWILAGERLGYSERLDWILGTSDPNDAALALTVGDSWDAAAAASALLTGTTAAHVVARSISEQLAWAHDRALAFTRQCANEALGDPRLYRPGLDRFTHTGARNCLAHARHTHQSRPHAL